MYRYAMLTITKNNRMYDERGLSMGIKLRQRRNMIASQNHFEQIFRSFFHATHRTIRRYRRHKKRLID